MTEGNSLLFDFYSEMLDAIQVEGPLGSFMTRFKEYCSQIREKRSLASPYESETSIFLNQFSVEMIDYILSLKPSHVFAKDLNQILITYINLFIVFINEEDMPFIAQCYRIFEDVTCEFYKFKKDSSFLITNMNELAQSSIIEVLLDLYKQPKLISITNFTRTLNFVLNFKAKWVSKSLPNLWEAAAYRYLAFVDNLTMEEILKVNEVDLKLVMANVSAKLNPGDLRHKISRANFRFAIKLATNDKLAKQFNGIKTICEDISTPDPKDYCKILKDSNFIRILLSKLHHQIIENFAQIVLVMADCKLLEKHELIDLWKISINQPSSTIDLYFKSILSIFSSLPKDMQDILWKTFPQTETFPLPALRFLQKIADTGTLDQRKKLFTALDAYYPKIESNPDIKNDLTSTLCEILPDDEVMVTSIQSKSFALIRAHERIEYAVSLLKASAKYLGPDISHASFKSLVEIMIEDGWTVNSQFFDLIPIILLNFTEQISIPEVRLLEKLIRKFIITNTTEITILFTKIIEKSKDKVITKDQLRYYYDTLCDTKPSDKNTIDFILFLFRRLNDQYYEANPSTTKQADISKFTGIRALWKLCFKVNSDIIPSFLCRLYGKCKDHSNIVEFVKRCMKHSKHLGSLMALLHIIYLVEAERDKAGLGLQYNKFIPPSNYCSLTLTGDLSTKIRIRKDISFPEFKEMISIMMRIPKNTIKFMRDSEFINTDSFSTDITPLEYTVFIVKSDHVTSFKIPRVDYFPSLILNSEPKYVRILLELLMSDVDDINQAALKILNEMSPIEQIKNRLLMVKDWNSIFNEPHKGLLMYQLHMIGNMLLENDAQWTEQFLLTTGAKELFMFVLTQSRNLFGDNFENLRTILQLAQFVFSLIPSKDAMKDLIISLGASQVENILRWSDEILKNKQTKESYEVIDALLTFLVHFAEFGEPQAFKSDQFTFLFKQTIFHTKSSIRNGLINVCKFIDNSKLETMLIDVLPNAACNECDEYFSLLSDFSNKNLLFEHLTKILYDLYDFEIKDQFKLLMKYPPPGRFTKNLMKIMSSLIDKVTFPIKELSKLCLFCTTNILFNHLKYFDPPKEFFEFVFCIVKQDTSIIENIYPLLGFLGQKYAAEQNVNHEAKYRGIYNPEQKSCYMSSSLQQLFNIQEFRNLILEPHFSESNWFSELQYFFAQLMLYPTSAIDPSDFYASLNWYSRNIESRSYDAAEFLSTLLERISKVVPKAAEIFTGKISHEVVGTSQTYKQEFIQDFTVFPIEIKEHKHIFQSFDTFLHPEILSGAEQYFAEGIGKFDAISYSKVVVAPKILIVQLKRFDINMATGERQKINSKFTFPLQLDLAQIMKGDKGPVLYDLVGITIHSGNLMPGHFYTFQKCDDDNWRIFNDSRVAHLSDSRLMQVINGGEQNMTSYSGLNSEQSERMESTYLLFYRMKGFKNTEEAKVDPNILARIVNSTQSLVQGKMFSNSLYSNFVMQIAQATTNSRLAYKCLSKLLKTSMNESQCLLMIEEIMKLCKKNKNNEVYDIVITEKDNFELFLLGWESEKVRQKYSELIYETITNTKNPKPYFDFLDRIIPKCTEYWDRLDAFLHPLYKLSDKCEIDHGEWMSKIMNFMTLKLAETIPASRRNYVLKNINLSPFFKVIVSILKNSADCRNEYRGTLLSQDFFRTLLSSKANAPGLIKIWLMLTESSLPKFISSITAMKSLSTDEQAVIFLFGSLVFKESNSLLSWSFNATINFDVNRLSDFLSAINDRISLVDVNLQAALSEKMSFIADHWILSPGENVRRNTNAMLRKTYTNAFSETQRGYVRTISRKIFDRIQAMVDLTIPCTNIHEAPIEIFFDILKWAIQFSESFDLSVVYSKNIINALQKLKSSDQFSTKYITYVISFISGVVQRGDMAKQFFDHNRYGKFIDYLSESHYFEQKACTDMSMRIILRLTPQSCFTKFVRSPAFESGVIFCLENTSTVKDDFSRFIFENISQTTSKKVYKTIFRIDAFTGHLQKGSSHYFKACARIMRDFPSFVERFILADTFEYLVKDLTKSTRHMTFQTKICVEKVHLFSAVIMAANKLASASKAKNDLMKKLKSSTNLITSLLTNGFSSADPAFFSASCRLSESLFMIEMHSIVLSNWDQMSKNITMDTFSDAMSLIRLVSVVNTSDRAYRALAATAILQQLKGAPPFAYPDICTCIRPFIDDKTISENLQRFLTRKIIRHPDPYYFRKNVRDFLLDYIEHGEQPDPYYKICVKLVKSTYANVIANISVALINLRSLFEFLLELQKVTGKDVSNTGLAEDQKQILINMMEKSSDPIAKDILYLISALQE